MQATTVTALAHGDCARDVCPCFAANGISYRFVVHIKFASQTHAVFTESVAAAQLNHDGVGQACRSLAFASGPCGNRMLALWGTSLGDHVSDIGQCITDKQVRGIAARRVIAAVEYPSTKLAISEGQVVRKDVRLGRMPGAITEVAVAVRITGTGPQPAVTRPVHLGPECCNPFIRQEALSRPRHPHSLPEHSGGMG